MATSVDTLITTASNRAQIYAANVDFLVAELRQFIHDQGPPIDLKATLDLSKIALPTYASPIKDATAFPVYEPPTSKLPTPPVLSDIPGVIAPPDRVAPTLNTSGLFQQVAPSSNLPDFTAAEPDLAIDALVAEMASIAAPVIQDFDFPVIAPLNIGVAPTLTLPTYNAPAVPDILADPADYATKFDVTYHKMLPEMQAFIDDKVSTWVAQYAPEYNPWTTQLQAKITTGMDGGILPDQFEAALFTRARGRAEKEFAVAETGFIENFSKGGFVSPPGAVLSGIFSARLSAAGAVSNQATDIYIERRKTEVQHAQLSMQLASSQIQAVRNTAISYAGVLGNTLQQAAAYANTLTDKMAKLYDQLIARSQLAISVIQAVNSAYEIQLKAALSGLEGYKLQLEAEKTKKEVELAVVEVIEAKVKVQEIQVQRYSAIIDAISRKGALEELKLKGYSIRADIFKAITASKVAAFDVYKASLDGDKSKLEGELSKLEVYETQIKADTLLLEAQVKEIDAVATSNEAKVKTYEVGGEVYKLDVETALQKFQAYAEVKKLAQSIYGQELTNAIESFKANLEIPKLLYEALLKQYSLQVEAELQSAKIELSRLEIAERASEQAVDAYEHLASSALGSLNTVVSSAITAAA